MLQPRRDPFALERWRPSKRVGPVIGGGDRKYQKALLLVVAVIFFLIGLALGLALPSSRMLIRQEMTTADMRTSGLGKLSDAEVAQLEAWFFQRFSAAASPEGESNSLVDRPEPSKEVPRQEKGRSVARSGRTEMVVFNVRSKVIHRATCGHAKRCTSSCVEISLADALDKGGRWCTYCQ